MNKGSIFVIADDLTGAAELGGIAVRSGLSTQIMQNLDLTSTAQVQILNTNTRSLKIDEAMATLGRIFANTTMQDWAWIYLKFDSALRGHIKEELLFYQAFLGMTRIFFCPVNPNLRRVIKGDEYFIDNQPIAETAFAHDPEFPVRTSKLRDMLGSSQWSLVETVAQVREENKHIIPAVASWEELDSWGRYISSADLCSGAAAFFEVLLRNRLESAGMSEKIAFSLQRPILYVCGSNHTQSVERVAQLDADTLVFWQRAGREWAIAQQLLGVLRTKGLAVFAIEKSVVASAREIRESMARALALLAEDVALAELVIEGGATAQAVLNALDIAILQPVLEYGPGVIRCQVPDRELMVTLKPGSYPWTEELWTF